VSVRLPLLPLNCAAAAAGAAAVNSAAVGVAVLRLRAARCWVCRRTCSWGSRTLVS